MRVRVTARVTVRIRLTVTVRVVRSYRAANDDRRQKSCGRADGGGEDDAPEVEATTNLHQHTGTWGETDGGRSWGPDGEKAEGQTLRLSSPLSKHILTHSSLRYKTHAEVVYRKKIFANRTT